MIAFPDCNWTEVEAALTAGNKLERLYELACGKASIATDSAGYYKIGAYGLKIIKHARNNHASCCLRKGGGAA